MNIAQIPTRTKRTIRFFLCLDLSFVRPQNPTRPLETCRASVILHDVVMQDVRAGVWNSGAQRQVVLRAWLAKHPDTLIAAPRHLNAHCGVSSSSWVVFDANAEVVSAAMPKRIEWSFIESGCI